MNIKKLIAVLCLLMTVSFNTGNNCFAANITVEEPGMELPQITAGLMQGTEGKYYVQADGTVLTNEWKKIDGKTYYFGENGIAYTGLKNIDGKLYYFSESGEIVTGMCEADGNTYYFRTSGESGVYGSAGSGWITENKYCYYFSNKNYKMQKSTVIDNYKLDSEGRSKTRYMIRKVVRKHTNSKMSDAQKIEALWQYIESAKFKYIHNDDHEAKNWKWYNGWSDDFAYQFLTNKGGNCYRYSSVLAFLFKEATDYQIRIYTGYTPAHGGGLTYHGWVNVKMNGVWYVYDGSRFRASKSKVFHKGVYSETKKYLHVNGKAWKIK